MSALGGRLRGKASCDCRRQQWVLGAHLVLNLALDVGDVDGLCEGGAVLVEFDRLGPVVECASNVDFFSRMLPNGNEKKQRSAELEICGTTSGSLA
jgi:hypothetical protein